MKTKEIKNNQNINTQEESKMTNTNTQINYRNMAPSTLAKAMETDANALKEYQRRLEVINNLLGRAGKSYWYDLAIGENEVVLPHQIKDKHIHFVLDKCEQSDDDKLRDAEEYIEYNIPIVETSSNYHIPLYRAFFYSDCIGEKITIEGDHEMVEDVDGYLIPRIHAVEVYDYGYVDEASLEDMDCVEGYLDGEPTWFYADDVEYCGYAESFFLPSEMRTIYCECGSHEEERISVDAADEMGFILPSNDDYAYCPNCCDRCCCCGDVLLLRDMYVFDEDEGSVCCSNCWNDSSANNSFTGFFGDPNEIKKFGIELEMDYGGSHARKAEIIMNDDPALYFEYDGSLIDGIEIISGACTMEYHKKYIDWKGLTDRATGQGYDFKSDTAGLHVHISRCFFNDSSSEIAFGKFFNDNFDEIAKLWQREKFAYCERYDDGCNWQRIINGEYDRYHCVNYCNTNTIEVRIFNSVLYVEHIISALELVDVVSELANRNSTDPITWEKIEELARELDYGYLLGKLSHLN